MNKPKIAAVPEVGREFTIDGRESLPSGGYRKVTLHICTVETKPNHLILALKNIETSDEGVEQQIPHSDTQESYGDEKSLLK